MYMYIHFVHVHKQGSLDSQMCPFIEVPSFQDVWNMGSTAPKRNRMPLPCIYNVGLIPTASHQALSLW